MNIQHTKISFPGKLQKPYVPAAGAAEIDLSRSHETSTFEDSVDLSAAIYREPKLSTGQRVQNTLVGGTMGALAIGSAAGVFGAGLDVLGGVASVVGTVATPGAIAMNAPPEPVFKTLAVGGAILGGLVFGIGGAMEKHRQVSPLDFLI